MRIAGSASTCGGPGWPDALPLPGRSRVLGPVSTVGALMLKLQVGSRPSVLSY